MISPEVGRGAVRVLPYDMLRTFLALLLALSLAACESILGPHDELEIGRLDSPDGGDATLLPDTVERAVPFKITAWTRGGGCHRIGPTEVEVDGNAARVVPFDIRRVGNDVVCPGLLQHFRHEAWVTFDQPGPAAVVFLGRNGFELEVVEFPHDVWVR
jgi:hypothetical protein